MSLDSTGSTLRAAPHVLTRSLGRLRIHAIQAGAFTLDGGAVFGVVPRHVWERRVAPDARNGIPLGMRTLLIEHEDGLVLVDTGAGNATREGLARLYGLENEAGDGSSWLDAGLRLLGFAADDVTLVINTHLHFDHAGGNTRRSGGDQAHPSFRRARYVVQRGELEFAALVNERTSSAYFPGSWSSLVQNGVLDLVSGERELLPGVTVIPTPGHVPYHQSVLVDGGSGEAALFLGDLCPTAWHLPPAWIMAYDQEPLVTLESKRSILGRGVDEEWLFVFGHDVQVAWGRVARDGGGFRLREPADPMHGLTSQVQAV